MTIARLIDVVEPLEEMIIELLTDDDHMLRMAAAAALARSGTAASYQALERALGDTSESVRRTAQQSVLERASDHAAGPARRLARVNRCTTCSPTACCWPNEAAWTISASRSRIAPTRSIAAK